MEAVPADYQVAIVAAIRSLGTNPMPHGKRAKKPAGELLVLRYTAEYRLKVRPYRVLYDIDDQRKNVLLLKLAKGDEQTCN